MTNRSRSSSGISVALCLAAALAVWGCDQGGSGPGTPAGPSSATAAAHSGGSTPAATPASGASSASTPASSSKKSPADDALILVLTEALQDEYHAEWAYQDVMDAFGNVKPFVNIHNAEEQHIDAVSKLFTKRGSEVPASIWEAEPPVVFETLADACAGGVAAEQENISMYDRLLGGDLPDDVSKVFLKLRLVSSTNHLPAFEKCGGKVK